MKYYLPVLLALALALAACNPASVPDADPAIADTPPDAAPLPSAGLSEESLRNAEYIIVEDDQPYLVRLVDGRYQYGSDPLAEDYVSISVGDQFFFGDLNRDGVDDAIVLLIESYGGTGVYLSLAAVLDEAGRPNHVSSAFIDNSPVIYALSIQNGEIHLQAVVHGPEDEACCPSLAQTRTYRLGPHGLALTQLTSETETGGKRVITIDSPAPDDEVAATFPLRGSVSILPAGNLLVVRVLDAAEEQVFIGSAPVTVSDEGGGGTFDFSIDLAGLGLTAGPLRIEVSDIHLTDGSYLAMVSVEITLK
ncbi:MAG: hypothetical protein FJZ96_07380 [Chloroflexi bacterium]|nr:hypothetical protein [Chloroflexota bacterium]